MASPVVQVAEGRLEGCVLKDIDGEDILAYLGVPYARPPLGPLRFKAPQPVEAWDGIKSCINDCNNCIQYDDWIDKITGSEDCLYLNIFTKSVNPNVPKPVLFYIHGGGFLAGSNEVRIHGPDFLLTEDIVLVTVNYRLGLLGFLSLKDITLDVPGNAGLKDQRLALEWVAKNIRNFGGDPGNVTICGESAGSGSTHYHVLSPSSSGLFHKAIVQSGVTLNPWAKGRIDVMDILKEANVDAKDEREALEFLRTLTVEEIQELQVKVVTARETAILVFTPVIEKPNPTAFITEDPYQLLSTGRYNQVPIMLGFCNREGLLWIFLDSPWAKISRLDKLQATLKMSDSAILQKLHRSVEEIYFKDDNPEGAILLDGDLGFTAGITAAAELHARTSPGPVYLYQFTLDTQMNVMKRFRNLQHYGACHGDDLGYMFMSEFNRIPEKGTIEEISMRRFVKLITNFVKTSNPTPPGNDLSITWKPVEEDDINYLNIGESLICGTDPEPKRMQLWRDFRKILIENNQEVVV